MENETREIFGRESENLVEDNSGAFGCSYETQDLISAESYVSELVQENLKDIEGHSVRVEKETEQGIKKLKHETSTTDVKESISAEYPVDVKIHLNVKSGETKVHVTDEQPKLKLETASQQRPISKVKNKQKEDVRHGESLPGKDNNTKLWGSSTGIEREVCSTTSGTPEVDYGMMGKQSLTTKALLVRDAYSDKKSSSSGVHVDAERLESLTGGRTKFHSLRNVPSNLELLTESKNMEASTSENLNECDLDIQPSVGGYDAISLWEIFESSVSKIHSMTGAKPKVRRNVDHEKTSLLGAESIEYEDYPEENFSDERNADVSLYENPESWAKRDYGTTGLRSNVGETEHRISFKLGQSSSSVETPGLRDLEESIELAHRASESVREAAFSCFTVLKVVRDGIDIAKKYVEIASKRAQEEGSENSRYQSDADKYQRILDIAEQKMNEARGTAESAYTASKNISKTTKFSKVEGTESTNVKDSRFLMNWARTAAYPAEVDAYKAAFSSLKAIKNFFREMDNSRNTVPSSDRYLNDLAKSKKRNRCINVVLILAFIIGCVTVVLYNVFKPGNNAYYYIYYIGFALIACSAIGGFCRTLPGCTDENVALEDERRMTIRKINEHLRLIDAFFKTHNRIPDHSE